MDAADFLLDPDLGVELIEAAGSEDFAPLLLKAAQRYGAIDELFAYSVSDSEAPIPLAVASELKNSDLRVELYISRFFRHDPLLFRYRSLQAGTGFGELVRVGQITPSDYRASCFLEPGFAEKLSFVWRWSKRLFVLSFYSRTPYSIIPNKLNALAGIALAALNRRTTVDDEDSLIERFEARMKRRYPNLSKRERQVISRLITGQSPGRIALEMNIKKTSIFTYKKRATAKIGLEKIENILEYISY